MLDIHFIRENSDIVKRAVRDKNMDVDIDALLAVDEERRELIGQVDELRAQQNKTSKAFVLEKDETTRDDKVAQMQGLKSDLHKKEERLKEVEDQFSDLMRVVPNIPYEEAPVGKDESANVVLREVGKHPEFNFKAQDYLTLAQKHDWIDIKRAAKVSGSRFGYLKGELALLEFALVHYTMQKLTGEGFIPVMPPVMVKPEYMDAMGFLYGDIKDDMYFLEQDQLYLVGTSEQSLGPMHAGEMLMLDKLPLRYAGFSTCFRREAGSYGKDTKGILRQHQFDKIEMESFTTPEDGVREQNFFVAIQEYLMQSLKIPYQVVAICTGDMGGPDYRQIDIESWMPGQNRYRETHTSDYMTDYQSRRLQTRVRMNKGETIFVHMNDATAFAMGRTIIAILENYQQEDGSIKIPEVLKQYMNKRDVISKNNK